MTWDTIKRATLCRWFGHKWSIHGITGKFQWCGRCALRREISAEQAEHAEAFHFYAGDQWKPDEIAKFADRTGAKQ